MAFITQRGQKHDEFKSKAADEIAELEALVSGVNQISQSTLLLKKKKEMHEVDDALDFMKEEYKTRIEACEERQREFERRQSDMKEQVTKFEKFIQENDSKRQRAEMKARQEEKQKHQKDEELRRLQSEHDEAEKERDDLIAQLKTLRKYKEYLERTVEHEDGDYEELWDLINRHKTLINANRDLMDTVRVGDGEMDDLRTELMNLQLDIQTKALSGNSRIHELQVKLEKLRGEVKKHSDDKETKEERVKDVNRETGQVVLAIRNLYHRCAPPGRAPPAPSPHHARFPCWAGVGDARARASRTASTSLSLARPQVRRDDALARAARLHIGARLARAEGRTARAVPRRHRRAHRRLEGHQRWPPI